MGNGMRDMNCPRRSEKVWKRWAASWVLLSTSLLILSPDSYDAAGVHVGAAFKKTVKKGSEKEVQRTPD